VLGLSCSVYSQAARRVRRAVTQIATVGREPGYTTCQWAVPCQCMTMCMTCQSELTELSCRCETINNDAVICFYRIIITVYMGYDLGIP
jgi:hypothetical protein